MMSEKGVMPAWGNAAYAHLRLQANDRKLVMWHSSLVDQNRNDLAPTTTGWRQIPISPSFTIMTHPALLKSIVGREVDSPLYSIGPAVEVLANAAINFHGKAVTIMATYYTNAKNAGVIDISTNGWTCAIDDICPWHPQIFQCVKARTKMSAMQGI